MDTKQSRSILAAIEAKARAETNLRNAAAMASDDPRSTELLESAGDTYAEAVLDLRRADSQAIKAISPVSIVVRHGENPRTDGDRSPL